MPKEFGRNKRIGELVQRELAELLRRGVKDERIGNITITEVDVSPDLRHARVFFLVLGKDEEDPVVLDALRSASGFLRGAVGRALRLRYAPVLEFVPDQNLVRGVELTKLIDSVSKPS